MVTGVSSELRLFWKTVERIAAVQDMRAGPNAGGSRGTWHGTNSLRAGAGFAIVAVLQLVGPGLAGQ